MWDRCDVGVAAADWAGPNSMRCNSTFQRTQRTTERGANARQQKPWARVGIASSLPFRNGSRALFSAANSRTRTDAFAKKKKEGKCTADVEAQVLWLTELVSALSLLDCKRSCTAPDWLRRGKTELWLSRASAPGRCIPSTGKYL